jgi:hypothetical protein
MPITPALRRLTKIASSRPAWLYNKTLFQRKKEKKMQVFYFVIHSYVN